MKIEIRRIRSNRFYTEGLMYINDMQSTLTIECTELMLPAGNYTLKLHNKNAHKRELIILGSPCTMKHGAHVPTGWQIGTAGSWIGSKQTHTICIGEKLIPGALYKAAPIFERIIKRLEKCKDRQESMELVIIDFINKESQPIFHWTEAPMHDCPPSKIHVEADTQGNVTIFDDNRLIKYISIEQQIKK